MIDGPGKHKQCAFVERMAEQEYNHRSDGGGCVETDQQNHEPERADSRVSQDELQIALAKRDNGGKQHCDSAGSRDRASPKRCFRQRRSHSGEQVNAGFDHGRRVQIRAHRRWRFHRCGKPKMKRELRRLGKRAQKDEQKDWDIERVRPNRITPSC